MNATPGQKADGIFPTCSAVHRTVLVGGMSKPQLLIELRRSGVELNDAARLLFAHDGFTTLPTGVNFTTIELSVGNLGCTRGATIARVHARAKELGLSLCPLELAPHLRLQFLEQPEGHLGHPPSSHRAPPGSLTVASQQLTDDDETPKGFYLRRVAGTRWLRGYRSGAEHRWNPEDRLVFCHGQ